MRTSVGVVVAALALVVAGAAPGAEDTSPSNFELGTTSTPLTIAGKPILSRRVPASTPFFFGIWVGTAGLDGDEKPSLTGPRSAKVTVEIPPGVTVLGPAPVPGAGIASITCVTDCLMDMGADGRRIRADAFYRLVASSPGTYRIVARITSTNRPDPDRTNDEADFVFDVVVAQPLLALGPATPKPTVPRAGGPIALSVTVGLDGAPTRPSSVRCASTLAGKALVGRSSAATGRATCTWRVPAGAAGKLLRTTVTVTAGGATASRSRAIRVR